MFYKTFRKSHNTPCTTIVVYHVHKVQALPISLAATFGIISLFYFRPVTKMFQFTGFPSYRLCIHLWILRYYPQRVSPFGVLRIKTFQRFPVAYRSFTRPSSAVSTKASFISTQQLYLKLINSCESINKVFIDDYAYINFLITVLLNIFRYVVLLYILLTNPV